MRTRDQMKDELSVMTLDELHRYKAVLLKNQSMGVTHLESMAVNDMQVTIIDELIAFEENWSRNHH